VVKNLVEFLARPTVMVGLLLSMILVDVCSAARRAAVADSGGGMEEDPLLR